MGVSPELARGSLRLTVGKDTTREQIERVIEVLPGIVTKLRELSPLVEAQPPTTAANS